ncbi:MAG TPA: nucleotidyltransferase domain-containing protein [Streptosporangiaceae bacterium]|nr:nucleotidyltransferase domain-containing protein [Streptosporangiaceae bacterium]
MILRSVPQRARHVLGVAWPFDHYVFRTQPEGARSGPGDTDLVMYSLRKYLRLAVKGNPTALLPLYAHRPDSAARGARPGRGRPVVHPRPPAALGLGLTNGCERMPGATEPGLAPGPGWPRPAAASSAA